MSRFMLCHCRVQSRLGISLIKSHICVMDPECHIRSTTVIDNSRFVVIR